MRKILSLIVLCILSWQIAYAQNYTVSGVVSSSDDGLPIPGISIVVKGTTIGTTTNIDGQYSITLTEGENTLVFSFVGMLTKEFLVSGNQMLDVVMDADTQSIDEVVVTGYSTVAKESYTGSAAVVSSDKIAERPVASFQDVLRGNSPGTLVTGTGQPGVGSSVRLRGISSMNASNSPLYVVDGIVWEASSMSGSSGYATNPLNTLNPSDIKSVTVLKDAASASLYGSRGANGVIVITTKQGKKTDKPQYSLDVQMGFSKIFNASKPDMVNKDEFMELWLEGEMHYQIYRKTGHDDFFSEVKELYADKENYIVSGRNYSDWMNYAKNQFNSHFKIWSPVNNDYYDNFFNEDGTPGEDYDRLPDVNWYDEVTQTAPFQKINLSTQGGSDAFAYYASLEYFKQEGVLKASELERYSLRMNLSSKPKNSIVHWGLNNMISFADQEGPRSGAFGYGMPHYTALALAPVVPTHLDDGSYNFKFPKNVNSNHNPLAVAQYNEFRRPQTKIVSSGWLQLNFTDWLYLKSNAGIDYTHARRRQYADKDFGDGQKDHGSLYERDARRTKISNSTLLYFSKKFNDIHQVDLYGGVEFEDVKSEYVWASGINFPTDDAPYLSAAATPDGIGGAGSEYSMFSTLLALNYSYNNRYYLSGTFRSDKSSRFAKKNRTGNFWSVSGAWRISEEDFLSNVEYINNLKLKASYGINGTLPSDYYAWQSTYSLGSDYLGQPGGVPTSIASKDLTWEENEVFNIGADMSLFNRLSLSLEYYYRKTENLLQDLPISSTSGFDSRLVNTNAGLKNQGIEADVNLDIIRGEGVNWNFNLNLATLKNEFFGLESDDIGNQIKRNGESYYSWYLREWAGTDPETGEQRWYYTDENGNRSITKDYDQAERRIVGKGLPTVTGGFSNTLSWKGFELSLLFTYGLGHEVLDYTGRVSTKNDGKRDYRSIERSQMDRWTPDNPSGKNPIRINGKWNRWTSTRYLYDGDYLKLKNIKLQYSLPKSVIEPLKLQSVNVFAQAENLFVITELDGFDPEISLSGYRRPDTYPTASTYTLGVKVNF